MDNLFAIAIFGIIMLGMLYIISAPLRSDINKQNQPSVSSDNSKLNKVYLIAMIVFGGVATYFLIMGNKENKEKDLKIEIMSRKLDSIISTKN